MPILPNRMVVEDATFQPTLDSQSTTAMARTTAALRKYSAFRLFVLRLDDRSIRQHDGIKYLICPGLFERDEPEPERINAELNVGDF